MPQKVFDFIFYFFSFSSRSKRPAEKIKGSKGADVNKWLFKKYEVKMVFLLRKFLKKKKTAQNQGFYEENLYFKLLHATMNNTFFV